MSRAAWPLVQQISDLRDGPGDARQPPNSASVRPFKARSKSMRQSGSGFVIVGRWCATHVERLHDRAFTNASSVTRTDDRQLGAPRIFEIRQAPVGPDGVGNVKV